MTDTDTDTPVKPIDKFKRISDKVSREPEEHPDREPRDQVPHPVTGGRSDKPRARRAEGPR